MLASVAAAAGADGTPAFADGAEREGDGAAPLWAAPASPGPRFSESLPPASINSTTQTVAVCIGKNCELRRLRDGAVIRTIGPADYKLGGALLSPDGKLLACIQDTGKAYRQVQLSLGRGYAPLLPERDIHLVFLWETGTGRLRFRLRGHSSDVGQLSFSADGSRLLSFAYGNQACLWDTASGDLLARLDGRKEGLRGNFPGATWAKFSGSLPVTVLLAGPNELVEYDDGGRRDAGVALASFPGELSDRERRCELAVSADRAVAVTRIVAPDNPEFWNEWQTEHAQLPGTNGIAGGAPLWYAKHPLTLRRIVDGRLVTSILDRRNSYEDIAFTPDGRLLASVRCPIMPNFEDVRELVLWDVQTEKQVFGPPAAASRLYPPTRRTEARYTFSPDSQWLLYGAYKARLLNLRTFEWFRPKHEVEIAGAEGGEGLGGRFQVSSDGQYLLGAGFNGEIRVWRFPPILEDLVRIDDGPLSDEKE